MQTRISAKAPPRWSTVRIALAALLAIELLWWLYSVAVSLGFQPDVSKLLAVVPAVLAVATAATAYLIFVRQRDVGYWIGLGLQIAFIVQGIAIGYRISGSILGVLQVIVGIAAVVGIYLARMEKARA